MSDYNVKYMPFPLIIEEDEAFDIEQLFAEMQAEGHVTRGLWVINTGADFADPEGVYSPARLATNGNDGIGSIGVLFMDDAAFADYIGELGLPAGQFTGAGAQRTLAISTRKNPYGPEGKVVWEETFADTSAPIEIGLLDWRNIYDDVPGYGDEYPITITDFTTQPPNFSYAEASFEQLDIILPASRMADFPFLENNGAYVQFLFASDDADATCENFAEILAGMGQSQLDIERYTTNYEAVTRANREIILVVNVFTYGFTVLISLIALANVFNTISTSIRLRRRELAMLKSIGLTEKSFGRMMNYECLSYGLKALVYGLPVSVLVTYFMYSSMNIGVQISFVLPLMEMGVATLGVFAIVFSSMLYSTRRLKKENIIDALRDEAT